LIFNQLRFFHLVIFTTREKEEHKSKIRHKT